MRVTAHVSLAALLFAVLAGCSDQAAEDTSAAAPAATTEAAAAPAVSSRAQAIQTATASIDGARISKGEAGNWLSTGRTYDEQRHSPLDQINEDNIGELGLAWYWDTGTKRGLEATPIIRESDNGSQIPIIALSAHSMPEKIAEFKSAGMDDYITKPFDGSKFQVIVDKYLN